MRTINPSLALASLVGFLTAASCTLITDVDRTKIPTDAGAEGGSPGTGGTGDTGATGGTTPGSGGTGEAGQPNAGAGGTTGGTSATGGAGGTTGATGGGAGTAPISEVCTRATGKLTLGPSTFLSDGDTFTLSDGVNAAVVFEFDLDSPAAVAGGHVAVAFSGSENQFELATLIKNAINDERGDDTLRILAETPSVAADVVGAAGAAGASGAASGGEGGQGGTIDLNNPAEVQLTNDLAGARGNVRIKDTVGNPNFTTVGMSGGEAVACSSPASCSSGDECSSGTCTDHVCKP